MEDIGLHLALQIPGGYCGEFASAWRLSGVGKAGFFDADFFVAPAKEAERGSFDAVFRADRAAIEDDLATSAPRSALEPVVLLALMARETSRVGLVATSSTTYSYPYTRRAPVPSPGPGQRRAHRVERRHDLQPARCAELRRGGALARMDTAADGRMAHP